MWEMWISLLEGACTSAGYGSCPKVVRFLRNLRFPATHGEANRVVLRQYSEKLMFIKRSCFNSHYNVQMLHIQCYVQMKPLYNVHHTSGTNECWTSNNNDSGCLRWLKFGFTCHLIIKSSNTLPMYHCRSKFFVVLLRDPHWWKVW